MKAVLALLASAALIAPEPSAQEQAQPSGALTPAAARFGQPTEGFVLSLQFSKDQFQEGDPVIAIVTTRNVSDRDLKFVSNNIRNFLEFIVVDEAGKTVLSRQEIRLRDGNDFQRRLARIVNNPKYMELAPSTEHVDEFDLREMFDLPRGRYTVSVIRTVPTIEDWRVQSQLMSANATFFSGGFKPRDESLQHQRTGTTGAAAATMKNPAARMLNATTNENWGLTAQATAESLPPEGAQNAEVAPPFAQAQGSQTTKLSYIATAGMLLLGAAVLVWRARRRKPAG